MTNKPLPFKPTAQCPRLPGGWIGKPPGKPLPDLSDDDIDLAIIHILEAGAHIVDIPRSNYGRRKAVEAFLRYERIRPLSVGADLPRPYTPSQPR